MKEFTCNSCQEELKKLQARLHNMKVQLQITQAQLKKLEEETNENA